MFSSLVLCVALAQPPQIETRVFKLSISATAILQGADIAETMYLLGRYPGGFHEGNPLFRPLVTNPTGMAVVKMGTMVGVDWMLIKLHKKHPKATMWVSLAWTGISAFAVIHNARLRHSVE